MYITSHIFPRGGSRDHNATYYDPICYSIFDSTVGGFDNRISQILTINNPGFGNIQNWNFYIFCQLYVCKKKSY